MRRLSRKDRHRDDPNWLLSEPVLDRRLDRIPDAVVRTAVRHLSSAPFRPNWHTFVDCGDVLAAFHLEGSFSSAVRNLITGLFVGDRRSHHSEWDSEIGSVPMPGIKDERSFNGVCEWMNRAGTSLTCLQLGDVSPLSEGIRQDYKVMLGHLKEKKSFHRAV